jgi:hypothetical protein
MSNRTATVIAALSISCFAFAGAAHAQTGYFGVEATAQTLGYAGTFTDNSGLLPLFADALSDPAGVTLSSPTYGSAYADVGAAAQAEPALLHTWASAHTHPVIGNSFSSSAPYGYGYAHFYDRLTVKSDTLPAGTPVTIVFGNVVDRATWSYTGYYDGYIDMRLQIGVATAMSRWTASYLYGNTAVDTPLVTVTTKVGSQLSVDAKLRVQAKAMYYDPSHLFTTDINADATASLVVREIPTGVTLVSQSGVTYPVVPAN